MVSMLPLKDSYCVDTFYLRHASVMGINSLPQEMPKLLGIFQMIETH